MSELEHAEAPIPRIILLAALAVALLTLGAYLQTLHPGVGPSLNSIELQIAALVAGIIHPPGSPQYLVLGHLAMQALPGVNAAYRLNLMSALFSAAAAGVGVLLTYRLTQSLAVSIFASVTVAFGPRLWYLSSISELYALNALYVVLVLYCLLTWHQTRKPAAFWAAVVIYALSFGNHLSMILLLPVFLYTVEITDRAMLLRPRNLAITAVIVAASAMQYLYIPLRAAAHPALCNYCPAGGSFAGSLFDYLTGGPFKSQMFALPRRDVLARLPESLGQFTMQFWPWGLALGIVGIWEMFQRQVEVAWMLVLGLVAEYVFVITYAIPDWHDFLTPCYVIFAPLMGYGAHRLWELLQPQVKALSIRGQNLAANVYPSMLLGLAALSVGVSLYTYFPVVDQSTHTDFITNAATLLDHAQPGAWLVMPHPNSPAFYYSWAVEYEMLARDRAAGLSTPSLVVISAPEVDLPPGPAPYYMRWVEGEPLLTPDALKGTGQQVFVLDWIDTRVINWGLLPVCTREGAITGYEVAAMPGADSQPVVLIDPARWEQVKAYVTFGGNTFTCPPSP